MRENVLTQGTEKICLEAYASTSALKADELKLHETLFLIKGFCGSEFEHLCKLIINGADVNKADHHGNTPLHLAVMFQNNAAITKLLEAGALVHVKNVEGWSPMAEAVSNGDKRTVKLLLDALDSQADNLLRKQRISFLRSPELAGIKDFYMEMSWDFHTWIPLLSRFMPSDLCKIYRRGSAVRIDFSLIEIKPSFHEERGDCSIVFDIDPTSATTLTSGGFFLDHEEKNYHPIIDKATTKKNKTTSAEYLKLVMSSDIVQPSCSTKTVTFQPMKDSFWSWSGNNKLLNGMRVNYYTVEGLQLVTKVRREHLNSEQIRSNKALMQEFISGKFFCADRNDANVSINHSSSSSTRKEDFDDKNDPFLENSSAAKPPSITFDEYLKMPTDQLSTKIGRARVEKVRSKELRMTIGMSEDFPLPVRIFVELLQLFSSLKHVEKLREFLDTRLPPGFPVSLELPIFPTISAQVNFTKFEWRDELDPTLFQVPKNYVLKEEDNNA